MTRCQDFLKLGTGHSIKHRCLNALSPSLAPAKAHIVASLIYVPHFLVVRDLTIGWFLKLQFCPPLSLKHQWDPPGWR